MTAVFQAPALDWHEVLDSGAGEKLERFGPYVLRRPDPQALWRPSLPTERWAAADLAFERESDRGGRWVPRAGAPRALAADAPEWTVEHGRARLVVRPTPFKHVGVFPEQAANWAWLARVRAELVDLGRAPRLLNLFGYTGAATVLAALDGWEATHVDASKTSVTWAVDNAEASGLGRSAFRVVVDDALRFARRLTRRGERFEAILLDPPHYGRGPKGEVWRLEEHLAELVDVAVALAAERSVVVLSTYAVGHSPLAFARMFEEPRADAGAGAVEVGELALAESSGDVGRRLLPAGFCARWARGCAHGA